MTHFYLGNSVFVREQKWDFFRSALSCFIKGDNFAPSPGLVKRANVNQCKTEISARLLLHHFSGRATGLFSEGVVEGGS
jgi:hypothetical protein